MKTQLKTQYDDIEVALTKRYTDALKAVLAAEVEMMGRAWPEDADLWYWGRATVGDLANVKSVEFQYGAKEDMPNDGLGRFAVIVAGA